MMKYIALLFVGVLVAWQATAQSVGIGIENPNGHAVLELVSPGNNQGLLVPKMTTIQRTATSFTSALTATENGLLIFDSTDKKFYYWQDNAWQLLRAGVELTAGSGISIADGVVTNTGDGDSNSNNEIQNLNLSGTTLTITNNPSATPIDLSPFSGTNTDEQTLNFDDTYGILSISNGNNVDLYSLKNDADADPGNELQNLSNTTSGVNRTINISDGTGTTFSVADNDNSTTNEIQNLSNATSGVNRTINISGGTGTTFSVADNDNSTSNEIQNLSLSGNVLTLSNGGGTVTIAGGFSGNYGDLTGIPGYLLDGDDVDDADNSTTNEIQSLSLSGSTLSLSRGGGSVTIAGGFSGNYGDLTGVPAYLLDGDDVDDADNSTTNEIQDLSSTTAGTNRTINISGGSGTTISVADNDNSTTNEIQTIAKSGNTVTLSGGGGSFTDAVDDADNSVTNEIQTISKTGNTVTLSNSGGSFTDAVDDADNSVTNEIQNLSSTTSGTNRTINISGGTGTVINVADNDNSATNEVQSLSSTSSGTNRTININGGASTTISVADNDNSATNELQNLSISGNSLSITGRNTVTLPSSSVTKEAFKVYLEGITSVPSGSSVVPFTAREYDINGNYDLSGNVYKVTVDGIYHFEGMITMRNGTTDNYGILIEVNSKAILQKTVQVVSTGDNTVSFSIDQQLTRNDAVQVRIVHAGSEKQIQGTQANTYFSGRLVIEL